jgi:LPS sulfotransferase NodH
MGYAPQDLIESRGAAADVSRLPTGRFEGGRQLDQAARSLGPPVVMFSASHSGSRLLAQMLERLGVFMGDDLNASHDSLPVFDLVRYLVEWHAPDFQPLLQYGDAELPGRVLTAFRDHIGSRSWAPRTERRWGWKLPETANVMPVIARLFPGARYIHLVRDGRDVAFSPFVAPKAPFWRKIYFNNDHITSWRGLGMTQRAYRSRSHLFNAARWVNSVTLGRAHGAMAGERYLEISYEAVVADPDAALARVAAFLQIEQDWAPFESGEVRAGSVGKWLRAPRRAVAEVRPLLEPTLAAFGYRWDSDMAQSDTFGGALRGWLNGLAL